MELDLLIRRSIARWVCLGVAGFALLAYASGDGRAATSEVELKAAFVLQLIKFVTWPEAQATDDLDIVVLQDERVRSLLAAMASGKRVRGKAVSVADDIDPSSPPEVVFLGNGSSGTSLPGLRGAPTLTISDARGFARRGGMIELVRNGAQIRIEVNRGALHASGLKISSRVLDLAQAVYD